MKKLVVIILSSLLFNSCGKDDIIDNLFQPPPVSPLSETIRTCIPIGYAATAMLSYFKGAKLPNVKAETNKSAFVLYINTSENYPYRFIEDDYNEMIVAGFMLSENTAIISVFFTKNKMGIGRLRLKDVKTFPVLFDNESIKIVYAGFDINIGGDFDLVLDLTPEEINIELEKLEMNPAIDEYIAIDQNVWIIDVYHNNTLNDFTDDEFVINGGQQSIEVIDYQKGSSVSTMQLAMLDTHFSMDCLRNPTTGYAFMQDVDLATAERFLFGSVFYTFHSECDGDVEVTVATGNFVTSIGKEIDLGLI